MRTAVIPLATLIFVTACGPMTVQRAERECFQRARLAAHPRGYIGVATGTNGPKVKGSISISSDFIQGKDPSALYDACVFQKSGEPPRRPLYTRPDWKG
ncbi:MAG: hypothetical protein WBA90_01665 [Albidovulum sp.]